MEAAWGPDWLSAVLWEERTVAGPAGEGSGRASRPRPTPCDGWRWSAGFGQ